MNEVAEEWDLLEKMETIIFRAKRNVKRKGAKWVKWLGVIVHKDLLFNHYWKSWILKARKLLGTLSGIGSTNWGISLGSW